MALNSITGETNGTKQVSVRNMWCPEKQTTSLAEYKEIYNAEVLEEAVS